MFVRGRLALGDIEEGRRDVFCCFALISCWYEKNLILFGGI